MSVTYFYYPKYNEYVQKIPQNTILETTNYESLPALYIQLLKTEA